MAIRWRGRHILIICLAVASLAAQDVPVFRSSTDTVRVFVSVTDRRQGLVAGLTKDDFSLSDNGAPQPIRQFDNTPVPIRLVVLLDVSESMAKNLPIMREGVDQLMARLNADDLIKVGSFGASEVKLGRSYTRDVAELKQALPTDVIKGTGSPVWRSVIGAIDSFGPSVADERRVIVLVSDGWDSDPVTFGLIPITPGDAVKAAQQSEVMIYCIGMKPSFPAPMVEQTHASLAEVAAETGGRYVQIGAGIIPKRGGAEFAGIADELHSQYLLGFEPPQHDGKVHRITVRVARQGMQARARRNYVAPRN